MFQLKQVTQLSLQSHLPGGKKRDYLHKKTGFTNPCIVNRGGWCFILYKNHIKQAFSILQVIHIDYATPVDFILIVSCSFLLNFERSLLFNVHSQLYNNYIKEIFISLVTSTWHSTWNGWHAFLTFVVRYNPFQRKYLIHQQNLMTHLLLIVFWFRRRSFIFRFDHSFLILPQIKTLTLNIIHLLWYFRIMISRGETSQKIRQWTPIL